VVFELKKLFLQLIFADSKLISPERTLAELILTNSAGNKFGEQQDFYECMDNVMDKLDCAFKNLSTSDYVNPLKELFFGKLKQSLTTPFKSLEKVEEFHQLIVDVSPTLIEALDRYFSSQEVIRILMKVEFENSKARKNVSILEFPSILTIRINRVKFDRNAMQTIKCNDFLAYPKVLHMERYSSAQQEVVNKRRIYEAEISAKIKSAENILSSLVNKNVSCKLIVEIS
jgi:hypothetical protein